MDKEGWPEFPLTWLDESQRNMEALKDLASHLHDKTVGGRNSRSGFMGTPNEMENQIIRNLTSLEQQVYVLTDVVQCSMQIIAAEYERRTTKTKRALHWISETWQRAWAAIEQNTAYRIMAVIGTIVGAVAIVWGLIRYLHFFGR